MIERINKVFVGMSGGVDSSVSAALLKEQGYDVTGVFIKIWRPEWTECAWRDEKLDAMRAAAKIGIPFLELDLTEEYKRAVVDYMIAEYAAGRTPNPDVMCNREIKFGAFWRFAKVQGADYIATGHYARIACGPTHGPAPYSLESGPRLVSPLGVFPSFHLRLASVKKGKPSRLTGAVDIVRNALLTGIDDKKDQSYFLWTLTKEDLAHILFPIGDITKPEVRKLAKRFKLPNAEKKDSQGLCFVGKVNFKGFITGYIKTKPGNVLDEEGNIIGNHEGSELYTLGERHGFHVEAKSPKDAAYYVISKNIKNNTITVSQNKLEKTGDSVSIHGCNWIRNIPKIGDVISVRTLYRQALVQGKFIEIGKDSARLKIKDPIDPITPGQSLVAYRGEECIGGGVIW